MIMRILWSGIVHMLSSFENLELRECIQFSLEFASECVTDMDLAALLANMDTILLLVENNWDPSLWQNLCVHYNCPLGRFHCLQSMLAKQTTPFQPCSTKKVEENEMNLVSQFSMWCNGVSFDRALLTYHDRKHEDNGQVVPGIQAQISNQYH